MLPSLLIMVILVDLSAIFSASPLVMCFFGGGAVASWLVRSFPERAVRVRALTGDTVLCSWARHLTLRVPLSTQVYKWVPPNCWGNLTNCRGVTCNGLASHPGGVEILLAASCYRNRDKLRQLWAIRLQDFTHCQFWHGSFANGMAIQSCSVLFRDPEISFFFFLFILMIWDTSHFCCLFTVVFERFDWSVISYKK